MKALSRQNYNSFLNRLLRICHEVQYRGILFTGRIQEITFATKASCLAEERCIPSGAHFDINTLQRRFERKETLNKDRPT